MNARRLSHCRSLEGNEFHSRGETRIGEVCDRRTEHTNVSCWCIAKQTLEDQDSDLELDSLSHGQPARLPQNRWMLVDERMRSEKSDVLYH